MLFKKTKIKSYSSSKVMTRQDKTSRVDVSAQGGDPRYPLSLATIARVGEGATPFPSVFDHFFVPPEPRISPGDQCTHLTTSEGCTAGLTCFHTKSVTSVS